MPRHTRRSFAASAVALAGMGAVVSSAQEATPALDMPSARTLDVFLNDVVSKGNLRLIPELIDASTDKADAFFLTVLEVVTSIRGEEEGEILVTVKMVHTEAERAIALADIGDPPDRFAFLYLEFIPDSGLIRSLNSAWHDY